MSYKFVSSNKFEVQVEPNPFLQPSELRSPALTLERLILSIASLLTDPNPDSPMNGEAASLFKKSRDQSGRMRCE